MAYYLYREKNWKPYEFLKMSWGEKQITRAFFLQELEEIEEYNKELEKMNGGV